MIDTHLDPFEAGCCQNKGGEEVLQAAHGQVRDMQPRYKLEPLAVPAERTLYCPLQQMKQLANLREGDAAAINLKPLYCLRKIYIAYVVLPETCLSCCQLDYRSCGSK